jgi:hypothetical protein
MSRESATRTSPVRELLEGHLETAEELASDEAFDQACFHGVAAQLRAALEAE